MSTKTDTTVETLFNEGRTSTQDAMGIRWHSYIGYRVDADVMVKQASGRMTDKRDPSSTVIHYHAHTEPCVGKDHTVFAHLDQSITPNIRVNDGYEMWGVKDPASKN